MREATDNVVVLNRRPSERDDGIRSKALCKLGVMLAAQIAAELDARTAKAEAA